MSLNISDSTREKVHIGGDEPDEDMLQKVYEMVELRGSAVERVKVFGGTGQFAVHAHLEGVLKPHTLWVSNSQVTIREVDSSDVADVRLLFEYGNDFEARTSDE